MGMKWEEFNDLSESEKIAMKYGAGGKSLARVIEDNPDKNAEPEKIFNAWASGENMRYSGESRGFLNEIEEQEMNEIKRRHIEGTDTNSTEVSHNPMAAVTEKNT